MTRNFQNDKADGVDVGITNTVALSDDTLIQGPRLPDRVEEKIRELQKELSRKKKGSKRREKARILLAKAWRKVRRRRDNLAHKVSNQLAK